MEALLTAIVVWLSTNYCLQASFNHPRVEFVSATKITAFLEEEMSVKQRNDIASTTRGSEILSLYNNESQTIYLRNGWNGKTPAELSILVHEMVHHLQNVGQLKFACPEEREELAYKAQDHWLSLFGHNLARDFDLDPFTILVKSKCLL